MKKHISLENKKAILVAIILLATIVLTAMFAFNSSVNIAMAGED